jgi:hypothetical protein
MDNRDWNKTHGCISMLVSAALVLAIIYLGIEMAVKIITNGG